VTAPTVDLLTTDPAAGLRAVAGLIRERATYTEQITPSPWYDAGWRESFNGRGGGWQIGYVTDDPLAGHVALVADYASTTAVHLVSFGQPAVAVALADLLDSAAGR
jgi:hypothetical protein